METNVVAVLVKISRREGSPLWCLVMGSDEEDVIFLLLGTNASVEWRMMEVEAKHDSKIIFRAFNETIVDIVVVNTEGSI